jgi:hypothetical protein
MKLLLSFLLFSNLSLAESKKFYQDKYFQGVKKYALANRTRVDCVTDTHAIKYDFEKNRLKGLTNR